MGIFYIVIKVDISDKTGEKIKILKKIKCDHLKY